ncbi:MAG: DUF3572 domain-containing protein [Sphingomonas sp.]|nr:DUF3572 domain-containing protein [Sphingomonas sp.]
MRDATANQDPTVLALGALAWTLADPARAERLLALTGLDPQALRAAIDTPSTLVAVLDFLSAHEPDLIACAAAIGTQPQILIAIRDRLENS